jgi:O-methyltransferase
MDGVDAIRYILANNIEGDIVECGVESGNFEYIWIQELLKQGKVRDLYLYDTFGGLVQPTNYDYTCENAVLYKMSSNEVYEFWKKSKINENTNNWCYTPLEAVQKRLRETGYAQDKLHYIVGDVLNTLQDKSNIPEKISILRLDTDWYESSKFELEQMYDNVVPGGVIIFDDYYHWDGQRRATDDFFASKHLQYDFVNLGNAKTAAIIKK